MSERAQPSLSDSRIEAAVVKSEVIPELVEWWGDPDRRITIRVEIHMGRYAERWLYPYMTEDDIVEKLQSASRQVSDRD